MKNIYFIRHGESEANAAGKRQGFEGDLTDKGQSQASFVAERVASLSLEAIVASSSPRAHQTAEIINEKLNLPIEFTEKLKERENPSSIIGLHSSDLIATEKAAKLIEGYETSPATRYEDAESFNDLKGRVRDILDLIVNKSEENILIVSHGSFIRYLISVLIFGDEVTGRESNSLIEATTFRNTGLTWCTYNEKETPNPWTLVTYNDHNHLADA